MKNSSKAKVLKALSVGLSASMALAPATAYAEEINVTEEVKQENAQDVEVQQENTQDVEVKQENAQDVEVQANIAETAAMSAAQALKEAEYAETLKEADEKLAVAEDVLSDAADAAENIEGQADESVEDSAADSLVTSEAAIDATNNIAEGNEALEKATKVYDAYTESVKAYEEAVSAAKENVDSAKEDLDKAVEEAKQTVVISAIQAIIDAEDTCNDAIDNKNTEAWRAQDELFKSIVEYYYLTEVYGANPDEGSLTITYRPYNLDEYNYFDVDYTENGVAKNIKLNYRRADENSDKELSKINDKNGRKLIIFEKTESSDLYSIKSKSGNKIVVGSEISGATLTQKLNDGEIVENNGEYFLRGDQVGETQETVLEEGQTVANEKVTYEYDESTKQIIKKVTGDVTSLTYTGTSLLGGSGFKSEEEAKDAAQAELTEKDKNLDVKISTDTVYTAKVEEKYSTIFEATIDLNNVKAAVDSTVQGYGKGSEELNASNVAIAKNIVDAFSCFHLMTTEDEIIRLLNNNYKETVDKTLFEGNKNLYIYQGSITVKYANKNADSVNISATATGKTQEEAEAAAKEAAFGKIVLENAPTVVVGSEDKKVKVFHELGGLLGIRRNENIDVRGTMTVTSNVAKAVTDSKKNTVINSASDLIAKTDSNTVKSYSYTGTYDRFDGDSVDENVVLSETVYNAETLYTKYDNTKLKEYKSSNGVKNDKIFDQARDKTSTSVKTLLKAQKETEKLQEMLENIKGYYKDQDVIDGLMNSVREAYERLISRQPVARNNNGDVPEAEETQEDVPAAEETQEDVFVLEAAQTPLAAANAVAGNAGGNVAANNDGAEIMDLDEAATPLAAFDDEKPNAITILDEETPLVSMEEVAKFPWWWILIFAIVGATTGYTLYKKYNKDEEKVVVNKK